MLSDMRFGMSALLADWLWGRGFVDLLANFVEGIRSLLGKSVAEANALVCDTNGHIDDAAGGLVGFAAGLDGDALSPGSISDGLKNSGCAYLIHMVLL